jgi:hypothetical protein
MHMPQYRNSVLFEGASKLYHAGFFQFRVSARVAPCQRQSDLQAVEACGGAGKAEVRGVGLGMGRCCGNNRRCATKS